jgi:hypothetical protein
MLLCFPQQSLRITAFPYVFRNELVSTVIMNEALSATRLGNCGWRWYPLQIVPAVNKGGLRTYAARSCLGTEVTEGSCITGVWVICRNGGKKKKQYNQGIRTAQVRRGPRAPVQPSPVTIPAPARAIRAVIRGGRGEFGKRDGDGSVKNSKKVKAQTCSGYRSIMTCRNSMCFGVPTSLPPGVGVSSSLAVRRTRPNFQMSCHSTSWHRASRPNALRASGRSPRCIDRCNIS